MLLVEFIKNLFHKPPSEGANGMVVPDARPAVLNVGGGNKGIAIPPYYDNWRHLLLDIDPGVGVDVVMDARTLVKLPPSQFDAVYCSHNLEHYFKHEVPTVLGGFMHILKDDGFAEIHVPNMHGVLKRFVDAKMEIEDVLYQSPGGPVTVLDVMYGMGRQIESSGSSFYAHKTGFTTTNLRSALLSAGFTEVFFAQTEDTFGLRAMAFKQPPTQAQVALLGL